MKKIIGIQEKIKNLVCKNKYNIDDLLEITEILRSPDGCAWDKEQTHESIRSNLIEEAYEAAEGIDEGDYVAMREELGDVLLQVVFHASIADDRELHLSKNNKKEEQIQHFDFDGVCDTVCKKLIYRHPHVFSDVVADDTKTVLNNWDNLKKKEKDQKSDIEILEKIPKQFPSLMRSEKIIKKAVKYNLDTLEKKSIINNMKEQIEKISKDEKISEKSYSNLLFNMVRLAACDGIDAEKVLFDENNCYINAVKKQNNQ